MWLGSSHKTLQRQHPMQKCLKSVSKQEIRKNLSTKFQNSNKVMKIKCRSQNYLTINNHTAIPVALLLEQQPVKFSLAKVVFISQCLMFEVVSQAEDQREHLHLQHKHRLQTKIRYIICLFAFLLHQFQLNLIKHLLTSLLHRVDNQSNTNDE